MTPDVQPPTTPPASPAAPVTNPQPSITPPAPILPPAADLKSVPPSPSPKKGMLSKLLIILGVVVLVGGGTVGGYFYGKSQAKTVSNNSSGSQTEATKVALQVPEGATITAQCVAGRGTQYIMPKDIPYGPIYDVYQNKVIGLEYMVPKDTLPTTAVSKIHYALMNVPYDHIDIGAVPEGHAGFTMTHYHLDFLNITKEASDKITCADTTPTVMPSMSPTATPTMSHM